MGDVYNAMTGTIIGPSGPISAVLWDKLLPYLNIWGAVAPNINDPISSEHIVLESLCEW